jgi:hypothetical protein
MGAPVVSNDKESAMRIPCHPTLIERMRQARLRQLAARQPLLAASLVKIAKRCGRPGCRCEHGEKHVGHYLTYKVAQKTHTVYVPLDLLKEVRQWIQEHRRLKNLAREISQLSIALVAGHVTHRKRRAGRS